MRYGSGVSVLNDPAQAGNIGSRGRRLSRQRSRLLHPQRDRRRHCILFPVEDLEHHVRRLLDFVGLDFEPACLEFYKTERSIRTVSSEQVRQPIYREGIEQWRNFEPWLEPLEAALGELAAS